MRKYFTLKSPYNTSSWCQIESNFHIVYYHKVFSNRDLSRCFCAHNVKGRVCRSIYFVLACGASLVRLIWLLSIFSDISRRHLVIFTHRSYYFGWKIIRFRCFTQSDFENCLSYLVTSNCVTPQVITSRGSPLIMLCFRNSFTAYSIILSSDNWAKLWGSG